MSCPAEMRKLEALGLVSIKRGGSLYCKKVLALPDLITETPSRTNVTEPVGQYKSTRGYLISSFLLSNSTHPLQDELGEIVAPDAVFAGFNLLLLSPSLRPDHKSISYDALFVTNHGGGGILTSRPLSVMERTCGAMSNGIDGQGANEWPKVQRVQQDFACLLQSIKEKGEAAVPKTSDGSAASTQPSENELETDLVEGLFKLLS